MNKTQNTVIIISTVAVAVIVLIVVQSHLQNLETIRLAQNREMTSLSLKVDSLQELVRKNSVTVSQEITEQEIGFNIEIEDVS